MDDSTGNLVILFVLIAAQALVSLVYAAFNNMRPAVLREQVEQERPSALRVLKLLDASSRLPITISFVQTLITVAIVIHLTQSFLLPLNPGAGWAEAAMTLGIVLLLALALIVLGVLVPESVGSAYAEPLTLIFSRPAHWLNLILSPVTYLLVLVSRGISRLFGTSGLVNTVTEEEIMSLVTAGHTGGTIEEEEKEMIYSVLQLDQTAARELMTPRIDIIALEIDTPILQALEAILESGFSRIPVYKENIDNIVGVLYAKDLLNVLRQPSRDSFDSMPVSDLLRSAYFVPETKRADELLRELQNRKVHMAIVVDEYGGTSGLVTIENLVEEIVGDIMDEYDLHEEEELVQVSEDEYLIEASMNVDDVNEHLDLHIGEDEEEEYDETDSLGGFIYTRLGRVPHLGETIETKQATLRVESLEGRRIRKVLLTLKRASTSDEASSDSASPLENAS